MTVVTVRLQAVEVVVMENATATGQKPTSRKLT